MGRIDVISAPASGNLMIQIVPMLPTHWATVCDIYEQGIQSRQATFTTTLPTWEEWDTSHLAHSRLVAEGDSQIVGWAALSPVSSRSCYAGVAEVSIYVATHTTRRGIGKLLMQNLITASEANGIWTLQGTIIASNQASIKLHEQFGFRRIGYRERIAQLDGEWLNTVLMERRSPVVG